MPSVGCGTQQLGPPLQLDMEQLSLVFLSFFFILFFLFYMLFWLKFFWGKESNTKQKV